MTTIEATPIAAYNLKPGQLFSTVKPTEWSDIHTMDANGEMIPDAGQLVYLINVSSNPTTEDKPAYADHTGREVLGHYPPGIDPSDNRDAEKPAVQTVETVDLTDTEKVKALNFIAGMSYTIWRWPSEDTKPWMEYGYEKGILVRRLTSGHYQYRKAVEGRD